MKKLTLFMVSLAITFWTNAAFADRAYVPMAFHYGSTNYTQLLITNLSSETVSVSAVWIGSTLTMGSQYAAIAPTTRGLSSANYTLANTNIGPGKTWRVDTNASNFLGTTSSFYQGSISVQSSATDDPLTGPVGLWAFFVSTDGSSSVPSGFMFPTVRRTVDFQDAGTGNAWQANKMYRWKQ